MDLAKRAGYKLYVTLSRSLLTVVADAREPDSVFFPFAELGITKDLTSIGRSVKQDLTTKMIDRNSKK